MDRLTIPGIDYSQIGVVENMRVAPLAAMLCRLAAYEDTGLSPEKCAVYAKAEAEGRLAVPPCKVGDTVWATGKERIVECYVDEAYLDDDKRIEYLVSFDCNIDCKGCPFGSWHQDSYSGEYSCAGEYGNACISSADFGKTVFLTREEAEKALEQMITFERCDKPEVRNNADS